MTTLESTMAATDRRQSLLALIKLADQLGKWLQYTDKDGEETTMAPERVRSLLDTRYYQEQDWQLVSPIDLIADKAEALRMAHDVFQRTRIQVIAWFEHRQVTDAAADKRARSQTSNDKDNEIE